MDQWKPAEGFFQGMAVTGISGNDFVQEGDPGVWSGGLPVPCPDSSQRVEQEAKDSSNARKVHKADREKLRRDRLNEQFLELGNAIGRMNLSQTEMNGTSKPKRKKFLWSLKPEWITGLLQTMMEYVNANMRSAQGFKDFVYQDPDRPKNDKATVLGDAILMLKDLTVQVQKLKAEHTSLSEESRELTQEKNELREEKSVLKSEIENLNAQYQQRLGCLYPWATVDPSVVMGPPSAYPFPIPVPVASGPMPFHAPIPLYPFFQNQRPAAVPSHCSSYHPYNSLRNPYVEQQPTQHLPPHSLPSNDNNHSASRHESQSGSSDWLRCSGSDRSTDFSDVVTELELKMPGSAKPCNSKPANLLTEGRKACHSRQLQGKASENPDGSSSSRCSSPPGLPASSSNSTGGGSVANSL